MSAPVRFGVVVVPEHHPNDDMVQRVAEGLEQARWCGELGLDSLWAGQHYLTHPYAYVQPVPLLARMAAEAPDVTVGTSIILLTLQHPLRIAEEIATLDLLTGGRVILGVGLGYREIEYDTLGVPRGQRVRAFEESIDVIRQLWTAAAIHHRGPHYPIPFSPLTLRPAQRPHPPIWMAANADGAVRRAARIADAWIVNNHSTLTTLRRQIGLYREELDKAGKPFPSELPIIKELYVAPTRELALRQAGPYIAAKYQSFRQWGQDRVIPEEEGFDLPFDELADDRFVIGDPEMCAQELVRHHDELGVNHFIFRVQWPGMHQAAVRSSLELFAYEVAPAVRRAVA
jgi:alkanesulfonate monooxygenase SsuD/methylene tetrahydromethanopterin reductase-like flavin-dependent oxidoreductase (luciferase family)